MDTETPVNGVNEHAFFVVLPGGQRGRVVVSAKPDGEVVSVQNGVMLQTFGQQTRASTPAPYIPHDQVAGIRRVKNADGSITPIPSEKVKQDIRLFVDTSPCWFPECESLRAAYNAELAGLPDGCPSCEKGALMRKYLKKMENMNTDPT